MQHAVSLGRWLARGRRQARGRHDKAAGGCSGGGGGWAGATTSASSAAESDLGVQDPRASTDGESATGVVTQRLRRRAYWGGIGEQIASTAHTAQWALGLVVRPPPIARVPRGGAHRAACARTHARQSGANGPPAAQQRVAGVGVGTAGPERHSGAMLQGIFL